MRAATRPRLVVLGLDGLAFTLARDLCARGRLPHLAALAFPASGPSARPILAELPELSPVNWTSFYTAAGPEEHGVFGITRIHPRDYSVRFADFTQVTMPTIFDRLAGRGLVSKVINLPNTYPARDIGGVLVSGFVAIRLKDAVYPPFLAGPLAEAGYRLDVDTRRGALDHDFLLADLRENLRSRRLALDMFWPDLNWDLFVFVLTETDRLFHFLYSAVTDEGHPLHAACLDFLAEWDRLVGEVAERVERLPEPKRLLLMADHGFANLRMEVDLNAWLLERDLLELAPGREPADELNAGLILPRSRAFAMDPGRIYLHTRRRFGRGEVNEEETGPLAEAVREGLLTLTWQGEPVMERVFTAEELYPGPMRASAPDLVCLARRGFNLKAKFTRREVFSLLHRTGTHTADDAFFFDSADSGEVGRVRDTGAAVLRFFGLEQNRAAVMGA